VKKEVIIFGAYGALGKGVSEILIKKEYDKFYLVGTDAENKGKTADNIVNISSGDLSGENNVREVFDKIHIMRGIQYCLFSAIGGFWGGSELKDTGMDDWERVFRMNLWTNFLISRYFIESMAEAGNGGSICLTSALSAYRPEAGRIAYGASKAALNYLIESLAEESFDKKIAVTGIAPYIIDTPANREWGKPENFEKWPKPEEIGGLVDFLFNNGNYLSGNIITLKYRFTR